MKRIGKLYAQIVDFDNLRQAEANARKGKKDQYGVQVFDRNPEGNLMLLQEMLLNKTFRNSEYTTFTVTEPKERLVFALPYYPDRIIHHAVINVLKRHFHAWFTADTYANLEGRGTHSAAKAVKMALKDVEGTQFCLKLDIRKYYPSIDHDVLKALIRKKVKDADLLWLLDEIIDSAEGLPIGNYLSQYFANFYLSYFDHWIKERMCVRYYFRYADDLVILAPEKKQLHELLAKIKIYMRDELRLEVKRNYQVFPVAARGIDFVGYRFFHTHVLLRKSIKKRFAKAAAKSNPNKSTIAAYQGWAKHSNSKHLLKKILPNERNSQLLGLQDKAETQPLLRKENRHGGGLQPGDSGL